MTPGRVGPEHPPHVVLIPDQDGMMGVLLPRVQSLDRPGFAVEEGIEDLMFHLLPGHQGLPAPTDDAVADETGPVPGDPRDGGGKVVLTLEILHEVGKLEVKEMVEARFRDDVRCNVPKRSRSAAGAPKSPGRVSRRPDPLSIPW